jgi:peptidyl-prolyl cis-trans isomerase A (cyclophilin A)
MRRTTLIAMTILGGLMSAEAANRTAVIETNKGNITVELFDDKAPITAANFADLATGKKEYTDPKTGQKKKSNYFDGLIFHRVIPQFMIQGGDPLGTGTGGPGYQFNNEIVPGLGFDKPGRLAMANAGPNTNGSQFFITVAAYPSLTGSYSIFGQVTGGQDVADAISNVPRNASDRPDTPVVIKHVTIKAAK